jgi:RNA polymerase sigma-70 factor (ECF subfamily)
MRKDQFPATRWSLVQNAGGSSDQAHDALATLCSVYWYPLYAFIRRQGYLPEEGQDLTQGFFARLLEKHYIGDYQRERGRFRSFLLTSLKHFLANERDWASAQKRGAGNQPVSIDDIQAGEQRYSLEPHHDLTPEAIYEKQWALTLLGQSIARLETQFEKAGRKDQFDQMKRFLLADEERIPYSEIAGKIGLSEGALKVAIHRLRRQFRDALQEEISHTVSHSSEIQDEIRFLMTVVGR